MDVVTTEHVIRSLIYDDNKDEIICKYTLELTDHGRTRLLSEALTQSDSIMLDNGQKRAAFFQEVQSQLADAAFDSVEEIDSLSFEYEGKTYEFRGIVPPS